jgi:hypothetical protein
MWESPGAREGEVTFGVIFKESGAGGDARRMGPHCIVTSANDLRCHEGSCVTGPHIALESATLDPTEAHFAGPDLLAGGDVDQGPRSAKPGAVTLHLRAENDTRR